MKARGRSGGRRRYFVFRIPVWSHTFMCSFSCPHFEIEREYCMKLQTDCVPGRPGCVLSKNSVFAVPAEERIRQREEAKRRARDEK